MWLPLKRPVRSIRTGWFQRDEDGLLLRELSASADFACLVDGCPYRAQDARGLWGHRSRAHGLVSAVSFLVTSSVCPDCHARFASVRVARVHYATGRCGTRPRAPAFVARQLRQTRLPDLASAMSELLEARYVTPEGAVVSWRDYVCWAGEWTSVLVAEDSRRCGHCAFSGEPDAVEAHLWEVHRVCTWAAAHLFHTNLCLCGRQFAQDFSELLVHASTCLRFVGHLPVSPAALPGDPVSPLVPALFPPTAAEPVATPVPRPWSWDEWWCASGPGWVFGSPVTLDCVWCDFRIEAGNPGAKGQVLSRHVWAAHQARRLAAILAPTRQCPICAGSFANQGSCQRHLVSQHSVHDGAVRTVLRSLGVDC